MRLNRDEKELLRLVESDFGTTNEYIRSVLGTGAVLRGLGATLWGAIIGLSFQQDSPRLALLGAGAAVIFFYVDGHHGVHYKHAADHLEDVRRVQRSYYEALAAGPAGAASEDDFRKGLLRHGFGLPIKPSSDHDPEDQRPPWRRRYETVKNFPAHVVAVTRDVFRDGRPKVVYRLVYPALVIGAMLCWLLAPSAAEGNGKDKSGNHNKQSAEITQLLVKNQVLVKDQIEIERGQLKTLAVEIRNSNNAALRVLSKELKSLLSKEGSSTGGLSSTLLLELAAKAASLGEQTIADGLKDLAKLSLSLDPTITIDESHPTGVSLTYGPEFAFGPNITSGPNFTFNSGSASGQSNAGCVDYLVALDELVDDDRGIIAALPHGLPIDAGAESCGVHDEKQLDAIARVLARR